VTTCSWPLPGADCESEASGASGSDARWPKYVGNVAQNGARSKER